MTSPRYGAVLKWLKEYWEWATAGVVVLFAFMLGRRGRKIDLEFAEIKEKENDIIQSASEKELAGTVAAGEKHVEEIKKTHAEADRRLKQAEEDRNKLVEELANDPDAIDRKLKELGIKEV